MQKSINIIMIELEKLVRYENNPRCHSVSQIQQLSKLIKQVGFINPIIIDNNNIIIAGHGRWLAAKKLGLEKVPCIEAKHLSDEEVKAYRLADNKLAENATWNNDLLRIELNALLNVDYEFNIELTGFETPEIDVLLHSDDTQGSAPEEPAIPEVPIQVITQLGDQFSLGSHRIACGDARDINLVTLLVGDDYVRMVFTDPPYNIDIPKHARGHGRHHFDNFPHACGELSSAQYTEFLHTSLSNFAQVSVDGALHYICMDWRHLPELFDATDGVYSQFINLCVWYKNNGGMGSFYRSQHELIAIYKKGKSPHINNIELGVHGRYRTNVWQYPGLSSFGANRDAELSLHATPKSVALLKDAILDATHPHDFVLDGFLGAGSTLMACEQVHRKCIGIELDPKYVDVTLQRWLDYTGEEPIHVETGLTFTELTSQRLHEQEVSHG